MASFGQLESKGFRVIGALLWNCYATSPDLMSANQDWHVFTRASDTGHTEPIPWRQHLDAASNSIRKGTKVLWIFGQSVMASYFKPVYACVFSRTTDQK